jgi:hypothetical protein
LESHFGNEEPDHTRRQLAEHVVAAVKGGVGSGDPIQPVGGRWHYWDTFGVDRREWGGDLGDEGTLSWGREDHRVGWDRWIE